MAEINKPSNINLIWASTGVAIAPSTIKYQQGWTVEQPPYQTFNYIINKNELTIAHINQHGMAVWDNQTEYQANKSYTLLNGIIYFCKTTNINQIPSSDVSEVYWRPVLNGNKVVYSSSISPYMMTLLDDTNASAARSTLGITSTGQNIVTAPNNTTARAVLGAGVNGDALFTSNSAANSRSVIGVVSATESQEGLTQRASDAEAIAGVVDTKFLTPKKLKLGFALSLSPNGFVKLPSWLGGLTFQWGITQSNQSANTAITESFNTSFSNSCFVVLGQYQNSGTISTKADTNIYSWSKTSFTYNLGESGIHNLIWFAIGY